ncbi:hypothetical protein TOI97_08145 [Denitrificimonas sp. JX-1]|uniref:Uncharacterized protein n=1 Tax=Denitrificimonas halotolerans TaxID=3098930 RepID=A0ABU5GRB6_9GAMM|nr:hypothetical protein [Denitrificimonas sp. JX-1]MDY7219534.1 hypothetical protein [Denitrificimonas sp. JX-1]
MKPSKKQPLFNRGYKIFAVILILAILTAIGLPKIRGQHTAEPKVTTSEQQPNEATLTSPT